MPPRWPKPKVKGARKNAKPIKVKIPSEDLECMRLVDYLKSKNLRFTHVANESKSLPQRIKNARLGTSKGFPDYVIFVPGHVLFIEMKKRRNGRLSPEQKQWIADLTTLGQRAYVCAGFDEVKAVIDSYVQPSSVLPESV